MLDATFHTAGVGSPTKFDSRSSPKTLNMAAQHHMSPNHGQHAPYVGPTGKDIAKPDELCCTLFLSSTAAFGCSVLVFVASLMIGGGNWEKNEGGISFMFYCGAFFHFGSLLLLVMAETMIRGLPTPQEAAAVAAREFAVANAALVKGVAEMDAVVSMKAKGWGELKGTWTEHKNIDMCEQALRLVVNPLV